MKTVALIGGGELAQAWQRKNLNNYDIELFTHEQFDLTQKKQCDQLANLLSQKDVVIITAGVYDNDLWNMWMINSVAPAYLVGQLIEKKYQGKTIVVSSNAANWTSWPDISLSRLTYNESKHAISSFLYGVVQGKFCGTYCVLEPSKFQSNMSNHQGQPIEQVVDALDYVIGNNVWNLKF
jgi:hypothetical protein